MSPPPELFEAALHEFRKHEIEEAQRKARFGEIRPQISTVLEGYRFVAVRSEIRADSLKLPDLLTNMI